MDLVRCTFPAVKKDFQEREDFALAKRLQDSECEWNGLVNNKEACKQQGGL